MKKDWKLRSKMFAIIVAVNVVLLGIFIGYGFLSVSVKGYWLEAVLFAASMLCTWVAVHRTYKICAQKSEDENKFYKIRSGAEGRFRAIIEKADGIIFEWDIINDFVYFSDAWNQKFFYPVFNQDFIDNIIKVDVIYPDDVGHFVKTANEIVAGVPYSEAVMRMRRWPKGYCWSKACMMAMYDETGKVIGATGIILDIDDERSKVEVFQEKAERDSLTGLYNKGTTENKIKERIGASDKRTMSAFFIIDIDNFKGFNDTYGHVFGDSVLREVSGNLKGIFRANDILGRIGGDEFVVFLDNMHSVQEIENKAEKITSAFRKSCNSQDIKYRISGSVGISVFSVDGNNYNELYKRADEALYRAKKNGKNQYCFYSDLNKRLSR